jgi:hypothetical protein
VSRPFVSEIIVIPDYYLTSAVDLIDVTALLLLAAAAARRSRSV